MEALPLFSDVPDPELAGTRRALARRREETQSEEDERAQPESQPDSRAGGPRSRHGAHYTGASKGVSAPADFARKARMCPKQLDNFFGRLL